MLDEAREGVSRPGRCPDDVDITTLTCLMRIKGIPVRLSRLLATGTAPMNLRRQRKSLAALLLGAWLFALFVGVANACGPSGTSSGQGTAQGMAMPGDAGHDGQASATCLQFCADDTPVFSKLQLAPDQPTGQPLLVATATSSYVPSTAPAVPVVHLAHPPPGVPVLLRSLRLAL